MTARAGVGTFKAPSLDDRPRVRAMVEATGMFRPEEVDIADEVFTAAVREPGRDYYALGAYDDDSLVGFVCYGPTPGTVATWDLYWIVVDPAVQRQGVGGRLIDTAEEAIAALGGRLLVVETSSRDDYGPTRAFYDARGYGVAARIAAYYAPEDDLIVFTKYLVPLTEATADHG